MSSITTSIYTSLRNSTESDAKNLNKIEEKETEIIFKRNNSNSSKTSLKRSLTINIKPSEEKMVSNPTTLIEKINENEKEKEKPYSVSNETKSILKNNTQSSRKNLKRISVKTVKFIDEEIEKENEVNEENEILKLNEILHQKIKVKFLGNNGIEIIENNKNEENKENKITSSNKQLAEIIYIPSVKNYNNDSEKKSSLRKLRKNNNIEDKVSSKCCNIL